MGGRIKKVREKHRAQEEEGSRRKEMGERGERVRGREGERERGVRGRER